MKVVLIFANSADPDAMQPKYKGLNSTDASLFNLILNVPIISFSVMSGRVFLGLTSSKQMIKRFV